MLSPNLKLRLLILRSIFSRAGRIQGEIRRASEPGGHRWPWPCRAAPGQANAGAHSPTRELRRCAGHENGRGRADGVRWRRKRIGGKRQTGRRTAGIGSQWERERRRTAELRQEGRASYIGEEKE